MKIHEYQAKELFRQNNVSVPEGTVAFSLEEALTAYDRLNVKTVVVKAQIHAGGRGKGGGVKLAHSRNEVKLTPRNPWNEPGDPPDRSGWKRGAAFAHRIRCGHCSRMLCGNRFGQS